VLDKSRTGRCKTLPNEQLASLISAHGGEVVLMLSNQVHIEDSGLSFCCCCCCCYDDDVESHDDAQVTHAFTEGGKMSLARYAQVPTVNSSQLAMLLSPDYLLQDSRRHQQEEAEREREMEAKRQAEERKKEERKRKRKKDLRPKRLYSAVPIKVEQPEEEEQTRPATLLEEEVSFVGKKEEETDGNKPDVGLGGGVKRKCEELVHKAVRLAKRRKKVKPQPPKNEGGDCADGGTSSKEAKMKGDGTDDASGGGTDDASGGGDASLDTNQTSRKRFEGKVFLLLGRFMQKQADMRSFIEKHGGEVASSLTKKVTHLLSAQGDDGTLTFKQARQRQLKIITEERLNDFLAQSKKEQLNEPKPAPTTPRSKSVLRVDASENIPLTPRPTSLQAQVLFEPSPSWYVMLACCLSLITLTNI